MKRIIWILFIFMTGCMSHIKKDGPPHFHVDERKIPNAVPKVEPLSRLGNKPTYVVRVE